MSNLLARNPPISSTAACARSLLTLSHAPPAPGVTSRRIAGGGPGGPMMSSPQHRSPECPGSVVGTVAP
eukprot:5849701-Pyramimonas_sp.AAC.1